MVLATVRANIEQYELLTAGQKVTVAVSGGIDSIALLHMFVELQEELDILLHVASLDHGIRGAMAEADLRFVARAARQLRLPYTTGFVDVLGLAAENRLGIEEAARQARYNFLAKVASDTGSQCVAVGHHALDQAETILLHILRGSGLQGLRGMRFKAPMPYHPSLQLIRPLLNVSREELERYCHAQSLAYRHDRSNDDTSLQRNFIRHKVLRPLLNEHPDALGSFLRLADVVGVEDDFVTDRFESELLSKVERSDERWQIEKSPFLALHPALQRRFLRTAFKELVGGKRVLEHERTTEAVDFCIAAGVGKCHDLGAGIRLRIGYQDLSIERKDSQPETADYRTIPADTDLVLTPPATVTCCGIHIELLPGVHLAAAGQALLLPVGTKLQLRTRRAGDRLRPAGMGGRSRKLKDWMIDRKIPRHVRGRIPLIDADGEVIAICLKSTWYLADVSRLGAGDEPAITLRLQ